MTSKRLAGIDIGTLTCRLLIADLHADTGLNELCSERRILRLGEGVDQSKRLKHEAVDRVIHCLKDSAGHYRKLPRSCTGCGGDERCARCR